MRRATALLGAWLGIIGAARAGSPIEAYGRLPAVELMRLSPSGERYATIAVTGEERRLIVATVKGQPLFVGKVGDAKVRGLDWAGDDHLLVTTSSRFNAPFVLVGAYEMAGVINIRVSDKNVSGIFENIPGIAKAVFGQYGTGQVGGHVYGYFGGITFSKTGNPGEFTLDRSNGEHIFPDLYQVDLDSGKTVLVARKGGNNRTWLVSPSGAVIAHSEYDEARGQWLLYGGKDNQELTFEKASPFHSLHLIGQGRHTGTALVLDTTDSDQAVTEITVADGSRENLFPGNTVNKYVWDPDTGILLGATTNDDDHGKFFDDQLQSRFNGTRKAFPGYQMAIESESRRFSRLIVKTDGLDDAGTYWLVDIASGKADPVGYAYPTLQAGDVCPAKWFAYKAADGLALEGVLTLPLGRKAQKLALIVMPHSGPIGVRDHLGFDWWAQAYASQGYAVFQPNYRGSSGYGGKFRDAGFGQWGRKMLTDMSDGVAALAAQGIVDPKRACIVGTSYGGYAALAGVTVQHGLYRCAVSYSGVADLAAFFRWEGHMTGYNSATSRFWRAATGFDKEGEPGMRTISPAMLAERADAPILLMHGKDDTVVPMEQSEIMADALKQAGKSRVFIVMKGEDHWLSREATRTEMLKASVEFVKKYNPAD